MPAIEVTKELYDALDAFYYKCVDIPDLAGERGPLMDLLALMDPSFEDQPEPEPLTQILPGPDGEPNEPVPADFFGGPNGICNDPNVPYELW